MRPSSETTTTATATTQQQQDQTFITAGAVTMTNQTNADRKLEVGDDELPEF